LLAKIKLLKPEQNITSNDFVVYVEKKVNKFTILYNQTLSA